MQLSAEQPGGKYSFLKSGAGEAIQPPKIGFSKKEKHRTSCEVQCFFGGE